MFIQSINAFVLTIIANTSIDFHKKPIHVATLLCLASSNTNTLSGFNVSISRIQEVYSWPRTISTQINPLLVFVTNGFFLLVYCYNKFGIAHCIFFKNILKSFSIFTNSVDHLILVFTICKITFSGIPLNTKG